MALTFNRVTVTTTATLIVNADADDDAGASVQIRLPTGSQTVEFVNQAGTSGSGVQYVAGEQPEFTLRKGEAIYGIVASGSQAVQVVKVTPAYGS